MEINGNQWGRTRLIPDSPVGWGEERTPTTYAATETLGFASLTRNLPAFHLMLMVFCPPFGMMGNVLAWSLPVDQLVMVDIVLVLLVFSYPRYMLFPSLPAEKRRSPPLYPQPFFSN
ncbi:MAG: hypothetical protein D3925_15730 [Candidatus Electrothrix sp. AR5]|nr:hypothetical protein [Candidatus Electrothrix sp. AR5]